MDKNVLSIVMPATSVIGVARITTTMQHALTKQVAKIGLLI